MKKTILYTKLIVVASLFMLLTACNDYLDIAPENDLIKQKFWSKTEDVNGALAATYNAFRGTSLESFIWGELRGDMITFSKGYADDYMKIAAFNISISNPKINWSGYYNTINLANTLMFYDKEVLAKDRTFTPRMKDGIDAEALFLRSLSYFYLVRLWKEVPLVIEPSISDTGFLFPKKSNENVVIKQIISDLLIAKDKAFTNEFQDNIRYLKGRANKYAIMALLADVYLWNQQYQKCIDYCDSLELAGFDLEPYDTWFNLYFPGNSLKESIFEIQYDDGRENQDNPLYWTGLINQIKNQNKVKTLFSGTNDIRDGGMLKYKSLTFDGTAMRTNTQRDAHFIYYRYADIILMKAEALNELDKLQQAYELTNKIVLRMNLSAIPEVETKEDMRTVILDERAREFYVEGKRWFDLLRFAKRNNFQNKKLIIEMVLKDADIKQRAVLQSLVYDTMSYYLPIPEHDIKYNQNLEQNPFYNR